MNQSSAALQELHQESPFIHFVLFTQSPKFFGTREKKPDKNRVQKCFADAAVSCTPSYIPGD
jgi:hypothetical protein